MSAAELGTAIFGVAEPQTLLLMGLVLIIAALMWNTARRRARASRVDGRTDRHGQRHKERLRTQAREDIDELMVRLEELSREICGQIDTRFAKLEHVLAEAQEKTRALQGLLRRAAAEQGGEGPPADPRHLEIFESHQRGEAAIEIARRLKLSVGEVELILSLERSRRAAAGPPAESAPAPKSRGAAAKGARVDERA